MIRFESCYTTVFGSKIKVDLDLSLLRLIQLLFQYVMLVVFVTPIFSFERGSLIKERSA